MLFLLKKRYGGVVLSWPKKWRYGITSHTVPLPALESGDAHPLSCVDIASPQKLFIAGKVTHKVAECVASCGHNPENKFIGI